MTLYKGTDLVCYCLKVDYATIRKAMKDGARTVDDIQEMTKAGTGCGRCLSQVEAILASACSCKDVSMDAIVMAAKSGAKDVREVAEKTGAGSCCGRCKPLIQNVLDSEK